jgi:methylated-DNA-protein-cysteine methyltransferase-like protein
MREAATNPEAAYAAIQAVVRQIPRGRVASYGQVARLAGLPGRARLVGRVLGARTADTTPLPWYRVINGQGRISLTGEAATEQQRRLRAEGVPVRHGRIDLRRFGWRAGGDAPLLD